MTNYLSKIKALILLVLGLAFGQTFAQYTINNYSINSGGSKMMGGQYEMSSSVAQADASISMTSVPERYSLSPGYWHENNDLIYKNGVE